MTREREPGTREDEREHRFGVGDPFSLGVEEELFLVDPRHRAPGERLGGGARTARRRRGTVEPELHACQIELITAVCANAAGGRRARRPATGGCGNRRGAARLRGASRRLKAQPRSPTASATPASPTCSAMPSLSRSADCTFTSGMPDPETAIRAFNGLRRHLPVLQALGANSPFRRGRDTGLASVREIAMRGWPRSGVPRAMRDFDDFHSSSSARCRAADVPDYTWFWWKLRPHPRLGTVEVRALDTQTSLDDVATMVALIHCLARDAATSDPTPGPPAEILEEAVFRAARYGVQAELPDADGHSRRSGAAGRRDRSALSRLCRRAGARGASSRACRRRWRVAAAPGFQRAATRSPGSTPSAAN